MKTSLDHLPELKRAQLRAITSIFCEGAPNGMLILFGSHARGDWVQDPETGYRSDYDVLFIVETEKQAEDLSLWSDLERRAREAAGETPVTLIVHDIKFVNHEIRIGQYFFGDIVNEGVLLHDSRRFQLAKPKALNPAERLALAERNFTNWFDSASGFWRGCRYFASTGLLKHAAFLLHQATERYYHAALLVFTGYKQRTHDIEVLGRLAGEQHAGLSANDALPKADPEDRRLFDLLKKAYVDARYSMSYRITMEELSVLQERVIGLGEGVRAACLEKMATFCGAEAVSSNLPGPPKLGEALLSNLPPPPSEAKDFEQWAQGFMELSAQRAREERNQGLREGRQEGLQEGEAKGSRERGAADILMVLTTRGIPVPAEVEQQIAGCSDPALLSLWLKRAVTAIRAEEVVAPAP
ncbi:MAG TPA: HEPN domain-containing protein [Polyangiaceae bacterium]|nr:HEPN domain-containing protein [Polyangiaceae bacterium]